MEKTELSLMDINSKLSNNTGVILVSHGSTLPYAEEVFVEIKDKFIKKTGLAAEIGYMKVSEPTIAGAVEILKDEVDDLDKIIVVPVFVAHGLHTKRDIPALLGIESDYEDEGHHHHHHDHGHDHGHHHGHHHHHHDHDDEPVEFDGEIVLTDPLGVDKRMYEIIKDRVSEQL